MKVSRRRWVIPALLLATFLGGIYLGNNLPPLHPRRPPPPKPDPLQDAGVSYPLPALAKAPAAASAVSPPPVATDVDSILGITDREQLRQTLAAMPDADRWRLIDQLSNRVPNQARNRAIAAAFEICAVSDPVRAVRMLAPMPSSVFKTRLANEMLTTWEKSAPEAAARWLTEQGAQLFDPTQVREEVAHAIERWTSADPEAAAKFTVQSARGGGPATQMALAGAVEAWSRRSPAEAFNWARALPDANRFKPGAVNGALIGLAAKSPAQAADFVQQQIGAGADAVSMAGSVAGQWAQADPQAAAQWASALTDPDARSMALLQLAQTWAQTDTQSAANWATALPEDGARGPIWRELTATWSATDSSGPDKWIATLPQGADRDQAVGAYAASIARTEPERALAWTQTLSEDELYTEQARAILRQWARQSPRAAARWANANSFPLN